MKNLTESRSYHVARRVAAAGLRAFFKLGELWKLNTDEQIQLLGRPPRSTFFEWKKHPERDLQLDTVERLSYVMGIYKALQILFSDPAIADGWVQRPADAPPFGGKTPLQYMLRGDVASLYEVRRYLDAQRGAW